MPERTLSKTLCLKWDSVLTIWTQVAASRNPKCSSYFKQVTPQDTKLKLNVFNPQAYKYPEQSYVQDSSSMTPTSPSQYTLSASSIYTLLIHCTDLHVLRLAISTQCTYSYLDINGFVLRTFEEYLSLWFNVNNQVYSQVLSAWSLRSHEAFWVR